MENTDDYVAKVSGLATTLDVTYNRQIHDAFVREMQGACDRIHFTCTFYPLCEDVFIKEIATNPDGGDFGISPLLPLSENEGTKYVWIRKYMANWVYYRSERVLYM